jgi:hypothetical protein
MQHQATTSNSAPLSPSSKIQDNNRSRQGRIPAALQAVFLASNRGEEVNTPPPRNLAFKIFSRMLRSKSKKQVYAKSVKNVQVSSPDNDEVCKTCPFSVHQYFNRKNSRNSRDPFILQPLMALVTPQEFLNTALKGRGYSTERYTTIHSGYSNMPTKLQLVSYDVHILKMIIRDKDEHRVREILTCGISPNACNKYGESLLHKACKTGQDKILQVFLDCGADIQVSDCAGRTPMHDACHGSKPSFKTFELLLKQDPNLIRMMDGSRALPLELVRKEQYGAWNAFLASILDIYWSPRGASRGNQRPPPLALEKANNRPAADPEHALSFELAALVSSGRMDPEEAIEAQFEADEDDEDESWDDDDDDVFNATEFVELRYLTRGSLKGARKERNMILEEGLKTIGADG